MKVWPSPHKQTLVISLRQMSQSQEKHVVHNLAHDLYGTHTQSSKSIGLEFLTFYDMSCDLERRAR